MSAAAILFAVFAMTMGNATVFAMLGLLGRSAGLTEFQVGAIFASSALLFFFTSSAWGFLADRRGRRPVIIIGLVGTAVSLFLFAGLCTLRSYEIDAAIAFAALLATRIVYGMLAGGIQPAAISYMADTTTDKERPISTALIGASVGIGSIAGPVSTAFLVGFDFSTPLVVAGVLTLLAAFTTLVGVHEVQQSTLTRPAEAGPPLKALAPYLLLAFAMYFAIAALQPTIAFYVQDLFKIDTTVAIQQAGIVTATFASCSFVVQVFVVRALKFRPYRLLSIGLTVCLVGIVSCLLASDFHWLLAAFGVVGFGYGLAQPGLMAGASVVGGRNNQGQVAGHMQAAMAAAWIAGALAGTTVYAFSIRGPLLLAAAAMAVGTSALFILARFASKEQAQSIT